MIKLSSKKLLPLFFFVCTQLAFGQITFQESIYDNPLNCESSFCDAGSLANVNDMKETYDNGYIVTGYLYDNILNSYSFIMKLDKNGDTTWTKYFNTGVGGGSVVQTCDGGYVTSGEGICKTDSSGNMKWSKYYPSIGYASYIAKTSDCGYILASVTNSFGSGGNDIYVIKTDAGGNPLWSKTYGGTGDDEPTAIQQTDDGGYIIAGFTTSFDTSGYCAYLIKTDPSGDTLWTKTYGPSIPSNYGDIDYSIQQTYDHGYILLGDYLIKTDSDGNVMWSNNFGGYSIQQTVDSGYIFLSDGVYLIKTNNIGNVLWARDFPPYGERNYRWATLVLQTHDGGYIAADRFQYADDPAESIFECRHNQKPMQTDRVVAMETNIIVSADTVVISASGTATIVTSPVTTVIDTSVNLFTDSVMAIGKDCFSDGIAESRSENYVIVYPNPFSTSTEVMFGKELKDGEVMIYNVFGQQVSVMEHVNAVMR